jgi:hypothetical protein
MVRLFCDIVVDPFCSDVRFRKVNDDWSLPEKVEQTLNEFGQKLAALIHIKVTGYGEVEVGVVLEVLVKVVVPFVDPVLRDLVVDKVVQYLYFEKQIC